MKMFPWDRVMQIGFGCLHLAPRDFWAMTLPELSAAARAAGLGGDNNVMTQERLSALIAQFPDTKKQEN